MGCGAGSAGKAYAADGAATEEKANPIEAQKGNRDKADIAKAQQARIAGGKADANIVQELMQGDAPPVPGAAAAAPVSVQFRPAAAEGLRKKVQSCSQNLGGFQAMFNMADCDKSKKLDVDEFIKLTRMVVAHEQSRKDGANQRDVIQNMSLAANSGTAAGGLSVREATCLFWSLDEDESGKIEYDEFEAWVSAPAGVVSSVPATPSDPANAKPGKAKSAPDLTGRAPTGGDPVQSASGKTDSPAGRSSAPVSAQPSKSQPDVKQRATTGGVNEQKKPEQKPKDKPRSKESIKNSQQERIASGKTGGSIQLPALEAVKLRKKALKCAEKVGGVKALWRLGDKDRSQALDQDEFIMLMKMASDAEDETAVLKSQKEIQGGMVKGQEGMTALTFVVGDILRAALGEESEGHYTGGDVGRVSKVCESEREHDSIRIKWERTGATTLHMADQWHVFIKEDASKSSKLSVREATCLFWLLDEDESGLIEFEEFEAWLTAATPPPKTSGGGKKNKF